MAQTTYRACLIGCGRMGATIDDEVRDRPDSVKWLPYSHAAACAALDRVALVAVADVLPEKVEEVRRRYDVPRGYTDYRELIRTEKPDILCIATRPGPHEEQVVFAAEHGVPAIYCEKPLCCSMAEADRMAAACERHGVRFNYGTQRRFNPVYRRLRRAIDEGAVGQAQAIIGHCGVGAALWGQTHAADMLLSLAGDGEIEFVQGAVNCRADQWDGDRLTVDPGIALGYARFRNGVHAYLVGATGYEFEISGTEGTLRTLNDGLGIQWRRAKEPWRLLEEEPFPQVERESGTVGGIRELVAALDTGGDTTGGIQLARRSMEMVLGFVASQRRGGAQVPFPLADRSLTVRPDGW
jgi:predicted dehydrogenase